MPLAFIARKGALARWDADIPQATHEGVIEIGDAQIFAAVLPSRKRLLTQATFLRALGRSRSPKAGTGVLSTVDGIPFFLQAEVLKPYISEGILKSTTPVFYRTKEGKKAVGYDAPPLAPPRRPNATALGFFVGVAGSAWIGSAPAD